MCNQLIRLKLASSVDLIQFQFKRQRIDGKNDWAVKCQRQIFFCLCDIGLLIHSSLPDHFNMPLKFFVHTNKRINIYFSLSIHAAVCWRILPLTAKFVKQFYPMWAAEMSISKTLMHDCQLSISMTKQSQVWVEAASLLKKNIQIHRQMNKRNPQFKRRHWTCQRDPLDPEWYSTDPHLSPSGVPQMPVWGHPGSWHLCNCLASSGVRPACNSWRGGRLTVTDSKDQREAKMEGQSPSVNRSSQILTGAAERPAAEEAFTCFKKVKAVIPRFKNTMLQVKVLYLYSHLSKFTEVLEQKCSCYAEKSHCECSIIIIIYIITITFQQLLGSS